MTFQIRRADLPCSAEDFAARVIAHVERLNEYYRHLAGVEADKVNPNLKADERRVAFPGPSEHPLIESAIRPNVYCELPDQAAIAIADYEITGPTLAEKKAALTAQVHKQEAEAIEAVFPLAKRRHWQFREQDIRAADHARIANHPTRVDDPAKFLAECRPAEDTQFLADQTARTEKMNAIQRHSARLEHDIADLTDETVDGFKIDAGQ